MTDTAADLIRRLEEATEGSRELDKIIKDDFVGFDPSHDLPKHWPIVGEPGPPHYTTSIDAALTLVPEGMEIEMTDIYCTPLVTVGLNTDCGGWSARLPHGTLPLALCIAALRARLPDRSE